MLSILWALGWRAIPIVLLIGSVELFAGYAMWQVLDALPRPIIVYDPCNR